MLLSHFSMTIIFSEFFPTSIYFSFVLFIRAVNNYRNQLITAHEDELGGITTLSKHEMKILVAVRTGDIVNIFN